MVPEGWTRPSVGQVFHIQLGKMLNQAAKIGTDQLPYLANINVRWGHFDLSGVNHMNFSDKEKVKFRLNYGDLLVCEGGEVGRCAIWKGQIEECYYQKALHRLRPIDDLVIPEYAYLFFEYGNSTGLLRNISTRSSIAHLTKEKLIEVPLDLPPLPEQRKIAEILSTWDRAIETTEALLATARTQKRAFMQSLLTGKRRFPEFEGQAWKEVRLGDVTTLIVSNVDKKTKEGEAPVRLCNYTDVYKRDTINPSQDFMDATATAAQITKFGLKVGDVIITKDSETADDIAMPTYVADTAGDLICGYHLAIVRPGFEVDGRFLKFYFDLPYTRYYFGTRANGAIRFGLTIDGIEGAKIDLPCLDEQRNIASVIAVAEVGIERISASIQHLRTEKRALMQQLLTGKRRVVV